MSELYKKKKRMPGTEEEKTAGFLNDLMKKTRPIQQAMPQRNQVSPMQDALRKAKFDAYEKMLENNLQKKAFFSDEEEEKTAVSLNDLMKKTAGKYDVPEHFIDVDFKEIPKMEALPGDKLSRLSNLSRNKKIGLGLTGAAAATGTGLYAYNRYKKKKRGKYGREDE